MTRSSLHSRRRGAYELLTLCSLLTVFGCSSDEPPSEGGETDCVGAACAANAPAVDWAAQQPTFTAHLRVSDLLGQPVEGATVSVGGRQAQSDAQGRVQIGPLPATRSDVVKVEKVGLMPQIANTSALRAGRTVQSVSLAPLAVSSMFDAQKRVVLSAGPSELELPARALAGSDGRRVLMAKAELAFVGVAAGDHGRIPGSIRAVNEKGTPTLLEPSGVMYVRFRDSNNLPVNIAPGSFATMGFPVDATNKAKEGEQVPLWSLDEENGQWRREGACTVRVRPNKSGSERVCIGTVDHFSYWAMGHEIDIYTPNSVGCLNATARAEAGACFDVSLQSVHTYRCDELGANCAPYYPGLERFIPAPPDVSFCGVMPTQGYTYRVAAAYDVKTERCGADAPKSGRRTKVSDALTLANFQGMLGSELMLNFTVQGARDCSTLCAQVPLTITRADLESPLFTDKDNDGAFGVPAGALTPVFPIDCNDERADVRPGQSEPFCVQEDLNCDGRVPPKVENATSVEPYLWNAQCNACRRLLGDKFALGDEVAGNAYDENCDGRVDDADGDGFLYPADCYDFDARVYPGATEVPGNWLDENCDGAIPDADGDGYYNPFDIGLAAELKLSADKFTDCDDYDPRTNPGVSVETEVGALRHFYYEAGDTVRRLPWFCGYFNEDGSPSWLYYYAARDRNCDGKVSDLDGDGFTSAGDLALGAAKASDCDDLDPRNRPVSETDPSCVVRRDLANDSECDVQSRTQGEGCPVLTLSGTEVVTKCEAAKAADGTPTGSAGCSFSGWWERNPLTINPGRTWGPCDGGGPLPDCPQGSVCLGQLAYTPQLSQYLEATYLMSGAKLAFLGMCFPSCTLPAK